MKIERSKLLEYREQINKELQSLIAQTHNLYQLCFESGQMKNDGIRAIVKAEYQLKRADDLQLP